MAHHISQVALSTRGSGVKSGAAAIAHDRQARMFRRLIQAASVGCLAALGVAVLGPAPASAMTMQECSAKYKAAQAAGTLGALKWNDFRKAQCGEGAATAPAPAAAPVPARQGAAPVTSQTAPVSRTAPSAAPSQLAPAQPAVAGAAVFPRSISAKYSAEKPSKQRMSTCLDQYHANKATNGNGGLKWIQKGGGYYSECNKRLKN